MPGFYIEVRDSRTGYFIPVRYGLGVWPDEKIVGAPPPPPPSSATPGNHLEKVTLTVLVFGPEWVSYERSRRVRHGKMREFLARAFFVKISKSQDSMMLFQDTYSQNGVFPYAFHTPDPAARPARPPVMDHRLSNWFVFQYFSVHRLSKWFVFQYFQVPRLPTRLKTK